MASIIERLFKAGVKPSEIDHHESDLYVLKTPASTRVINQYKHKANVTTFFSEIDKRVWYDIPFAFEGRNPHRGRFDVIEYSSGFAVVDSVTGKEAWMGDGVDMLFTETGRAINPGTVTFVSKLKQFLNYDENETLEAYFPKQWEKEGE